MFGGGSRLDDAPFRLFADAAAHLVSLLSRQRYGLASDRDLLSIPTAGDQRTRAQDCRPQACRKGVTVPNRAAYRPNASRALGSRSARPGE